MAKKHFILSIDGGGIASPENIKRLKAEAANIIAANAASLDAIVAAL